MKKVIIFGSTGSIGRQTLEVIEKIDGYEVLGLSCNKNISLLKEQIAKYKPKYVCVSDESDSKEIKNDFPYLNTYFGEEGLIQIVEENLYDILVVATSGIISVRAVLKAIENNKTIALANKETLVMAGDIVMKKARDYNTPIIPIDSEHSAILQCINKFSDNYAKNLWITASGGPFLNSTREDMANYTAEEALQHPRWNMGKKITIDCSTLVNKGLEVIEAHHLYNMDYSNIKVVIHPESLVHSFVEFIDGSFLAQMGVPSMHIPIQYALTYPTRQEGIKTESFVPWGKKLEFFEPDFEKFPLLKLAIECGKKGGIMPAVLNAANEVAVYKFLNNEIGFLDIEKLILKELDRFVNIINPGIEEIFEADRLTRFNMSNKDYKVPNASI